MKYKNKIKFPFFFSRFLKAMWTIPGTLTMLGWRQLLSTSTMNQVAIVFFFLHPLDTYTHRLVLKPLSLLSSPNLLFRSTMTRCYHRQQRERAAAASWRWRRTCPVGWCWLELIALCKSFQLPGAGCQREKSPLVTKDEGELQWHSERNSNETLNWTLNWLWFINVSVMTHMSCMSTAHDASCDF